LTGNGQKKPLPRNSSGSFAKFAAIRRLVAGGRLVADRFCGSSSK
jgi:hypothetical protein